MTIDPLRYDKANGTSKRCKCLPSKEREKYILHVSKSSKSVIVIRQRNRYIDEFLRFIDKEYGHHSPRKLSKEQVDHYFTCLSSSTDIKKATANIKKQYSSALVGLVVTK